MVVEQYVDELYLAARLLFGSAVVAMGANQLASADAAIKYTQWKGPPDPAFAKVGVFGTAPLLVVAGVLIAMDTYLPYAAAFVVLFFAVVTPMHDFWNMDDPLERQEELISFLVNTAVIGGALALTALSVALQSA